MDSLQYSFLIVFIQFLGTSHKASAISCFTCSSRNSSDITCEDPFQPGPFSYTEKCKVPKRGHKDGLFPAHFCIKLVGISATSREKLVVRRCVMQNMENQCGKFKLENETLHGCLLTCDMDGCNSAPSVSSNILMVMLATITTLCTLFLHNDDCDNVKSQRIKGQEKTFDNFLQTKPSQLNIENKSFNNLMNIPHHTTNDLRTNNYYSIESKPIIACV